MVLAAAMLTPACGNNAGKETKAEVQESAAVQANVTHLTKADFLAKVYNYEKNPKEWKYEGDKPAIVDSMPLGVAHVSYRPGTGETGCGI